MTGPVLAQVSNPVLEMSLGLCVIAGCAVLGGTIGLMILNRFVKNYVVTAVDIMQASVTKSMPKVAERQ